MRRLEIGVVAVLTEDLQGLLALGALSRGDNLSHKPLPFRVGVVGRSLGESAKKPPPVRSGNQDVATALWKTRLYPDSQSCPPVYQNQGRLSILCLHKLARHHFRGVVNCRIIRERLVAAHTLWGTNGWWELV